VIALGKYARQPLRAADPLPSEQGAFGTGFGRLLIGGQNGQLLAGVNVRLVGGAAGSVSSVSSPVWARVVKDVEVVKVLGLEFLTRPGGITVTAGLSRQPDRQGFDWKNHDR
jgi:hypothetical protein